jgi:hypothetical protein
MGSYFSSEPKEEWNSYQMRLKYFVNEDIKKGDFKLNQSNLKKPLLFERVVKKRNKKLKIKKNGYFIK